MKCENCGIDHDGSYGSGRFCSCKCARGFGTKEKRKEINDKVSKKLKGIKTNRSPFNKGYDPRRRKWSDIDRQKFLQKRKEKEQYIYNNSPFDTLSIRNKRKKVIEEQNGKCASCGNDTWLGKPIKLDIHHKDAIKKNNTRENLIALCPNCHSFTETWKVGLKRARIDKLA